MTSRVPFSLSEKSGPRVVGYLNRWLHGGIKARETAFFKCCFLIISVDRGLDEPFFIIFHDMHRSIVSFGSSSMRLNSIPKPYLGIWCRTLLEQADQVDNTSLVLWIQTNHHHVDLRIPDSRPIFEPVSHLIDYSFEQLIHLANQQGFTGITEVNANIAEWKREQDYQPFNHQRDIAEMRFEDDSTLVERGVDAEYLERWEKVPNSHLNLSFRTAAGEDRHGNKVFARLFIANTTFAYVRPRSIQLPSAKSMLVAIDAHQPSKDVLLDWLDFEISFGQIKNGNQGCISHSTFPFREGCILQLDAL